MSYTVTASDAMFSHGLLCTTPKVVAIERIYSASGDCTLCQNHSLNDMPDPNT